jgi:hypothetical protein
MSEQLVHEWTLSPVFSIDFGTTDMCTGIKLKIDVERV